MEDAASERLDRLRLWSNGNGPPYEWRTSKDHWLVFVAEMLLRRTRAEQVAALLPAAIEVFPAPAFLAGAEPAAARAVFRSAGLEGRIDQLRAAAAVMVENFEGKVPSDEESLRSLPGVGPYVAAIVSARLTESEVVLVDTNSVRVATRVLGIHPTTKDPRRERVVVEAVAGLLGGPAKASDWFALIDLAHMVCRPTSPVCHECPISRACVYAAVVGI